MDQSDQSTASKHPIRRMMNTLFVALSALFSLFTAVNSSDIKELHVRTVKRGGDVTMECDISSVTEKDKLVWYRQRSGKLPQYFC
ncbi:hypothetical protein QTP70_032523 [Hemibagrus guttatus]|uniref:Ig-like domain-containing protein n=1 Tax=Hemibagrus guttatus TaxID=175788 RepID=A0AAE0URA8_9TELE|nr:hypothetical protein QTP70_032523 [Hemibagrus guttatus]